MNKLPTLCIYQKQTRQIIAIITEVDIKDKDIILARDLDSVMVPPESSFIIGDEITGQLLIRREYIDNITDINEYKRIKGDI